MTVRERAELEALVAPSTAAIRAVLFVGAVAAVGGVLWFLQETVSTFIVPVVTAPLWIIPTAFFGAWLYARSVHWTGGPILRRTIRADLAAGRMAQHRVEVVDALEAPEIEDEGPVFFVRTEGGETLFLAGQDMAFLKTRGFPWQAFDIEEAPRSKQLFRVERHGPAFAPVRQRAPLSMAEARALGVLRNPYGLLDVDLAALEDAS